MVNEKRQSVNPDCSSWKEADPMPLEYKNLDATKAYAGLKNIDAGAISLKRILTPERIAACSIPAGEDLTYNYAAKKVTDEVLGRLQQLADEQQLIAKFEDLYNGGIANPGEKRQVLHHLLRGRLGKVVVHDGKDLGAFYAEQQKKIADFCAGVHKGKIKGSTGKRFKTVVQIGIGGSDLGPRALYLAIEQYARERGLLKMQARFISNVDPDDANGVLAGLNLETTLFILVSKSGITQETLANEQLVRSKMVSAGLDPNKHMIAVTSETSPLAKSSEYVASFFIDDFIGGRYSSTSAVGGAILSLAFGPEVFEEILAGAHEADVLARNASIRENAALMDALIGVWERNFLLYPYTAILPYCQALLRFPAHLQQLDMESNGKSVSRDNERLKYSTGPVVFGEPGTNGQHSFYQLLHQGTDIVPLQFIGFKKAQTGFDIDVEGSTSEKKLNANLTAQIMAFAVGRENANRNKNFEGERPSSLLHGDTLTPESLGALLAHFENKVMFQGLTWNINSFDQEGVQLGKALTKEVLGGTTDQRLLAYAKLLGV
jgi:glucose-6-phosphate isomerase